MTRSLGLGASVPRVVQHISSQAYHAQCVGVLKKYVSLGPSTKVAKIGMIRFVVRFVSVCLANQDSLGSLNISKQSQDEF